MLSLLLSTSFETLSTVLFATDQPIQHYAAATSWFIELTVSANLWLQKLTSSPVYVRALYVDPVGCHDANTRKSYVSVSGSKLVLTLCPTTYSSRAKWGGDGRWSRMDSCRSSNVYDNHCRYHRCCQWTTLLLSTSFETLSTVFRSTDSALCSCNLVIHRAYS